MYVKPGAMFITASGTGLAATCNTSREDVELLGEILGITDWSKAFAMTESCEDPQDIEMYCKFTSVEDGVSTKILMS